MEDDTTLALTLSLFISILLGAIGLISALWGLRGGQFDDANRSGAAVLFDSEDDLNAAKDREDRQKEAEKNAEKLAENSSESER